MSNFLNVHITGERSIRFAFSDQVGEETFHQVQSFCAMVENHFLVEEVVPSYHTVTIYLKKNLENKESFVVSLLTKWDQHVQDGFERHFRRLRIPVCFEEEFALDMERVMKQTGLSEKEIIALHSAPSYTVYMIGFLPGFPYLGGLEEKLMTPRLHTPRAKVPKGAVGIGGSQTGIYPIDCPGGWNLIGKSPVEVYRPDREEPFFIRTGDRLEFVPISITEFFEIKKQLEKHPDSIMEFIEGGGPN